MNLNEFEGLVLFDDNGLGVDGLDILRASGRIRNDLTMWANIAVLAAMLIVIRFSAFLLLLRKISSAGLKKVRSSEFASTLNKLEEQSISKIENPAAVDGIQNSA